MAFQPSTEVKRDWLAVPAQRDDTTAPLTLADTSVAAFLRRRASRRGRRGRCAHGRHRRRTQHPRVLPGVKALAAARPAKGGLSALTPAPRALQTGNCPTMPDPDPARRQPRHPATEPDPAGRTASTADKRRPEDGRSGSGSREAGNTDPIVAPAGCHRVRARHTTGTPTRRPCVLVDPPDRNAGQAGTRRTDSGREGGQPQCAYIGAGEGMLRSPRTPRAPGSSRRTAAPAALQSERLRRASADTRSPASRPPRPLLSARSRLARAVLQCHSQPSSSGWSLPVHLHRQCRRDAPIARADPASGNRYSCTPASPCRRITSRPPRIKASMSCRGLGPR